MSIYAADSERVDAHSLSASVWPFFSFNRDAEFTLREGDCRLVNLNSMGRMAFISCAYWLGWVTRRKYLVVFGGVQSLGLP